MATIELSVLAQYRAVQDSTVQRCLYFFGRYGSPSLWVQRMPIDVLLLCELVSHTVALDTRVGGGRTGLVGSGCLSIFFCFEELFSHTVALDARAGGDRLGLFALRVVRVTLTSSSSASSTCGHH